MCCVTAGDESSGLAHSDPGSQTEIRVRDDPGQAEERRGDRGQ